MLRGEFIRQEVPEWLQNFCDLHGLIVVPHQNDDKEWFFRYTTTIALKPGDMLKLDLYPWRPLEEIRQKIRGTWPELGL